MQAWSRRSAGNPGALKGRRNGGCRGDGGGSGKLLRYGVRPVLVVYSLTIPEVRYLSKKVAR